MRIPLLRKAFSRSRSESLSKLNSIVSKICVSGLKVIFVPRFRVLPVCLSSATEIPRSYSCSYGRPSRQISRCSVAVSRQGIVNGVIDDFVDQVMQAHLARGSDIHGRPLAHGLAPFQY